MQLAGLFFLSIMALCLLKISRAEIARTHSHSVALQLDRPDERDTKNDGTIIRRAVRKYPEDSEYMNTGHRQASIRVSPEECSCQSVLDKDTLLAIVAALAFLGFFSTLILVVVGVCILRFMEQQKKEKGEKPAHTSQRRRAPPIPPPRPEHTYLTVRPLQKYERLHPASPRAAQGVYLSASELNPGPRGRREKHYQNIKRTPTEPKSTPENEYISPGSALAFSTPTSEKKYVNIDQSKPSSLTGSVQDSTLSPLLSPKGRENHIYEEVE